MKGMLRWRLILACVGSVVFCGCSSSNTKVKAEDAPQERGPIACTMGKERNEDTAGHCCYAGQVWADGKCVGVPQCPAHYTVRGEDCRAPIEPPAGYALIPAGSFMMGSTINEIDDDEKPVHQVKISRGFFLKKTEVTQEEWSTLMGSNPSACESGCSPDRPVNMVSWYEGLEYMNKLSERDGLEKCYEKVGEVWRWSKGLDCEGYRYPTEAEWEYAARGGTTGELYGALGEIGWYSVNSEDKVSPVGKMVANRYGLYDMLGNVWEWTWDNFDDYSSGAQEDPIGGGLQQSGDLSRVFRGCGWLSIVQKCRVAYRFTGSPDHRDDDLGLRPARSSH